MEQLEKDKRIHQKIKRFKTKQAQMRHLFQEVSGKHTLKPVSLGVSQLDALILMLFVANAIVFFRTRSLLIQTTWRWTGSWMCPTVWTRTTAR